MLCYAADPARQLLLAWARMLCCAMLCYACYDLLSTLLAACFLWPKLSYAMLCYAMLCDAMLTLLASFLWRGRLRVCYAMLAMLLDPARQLLVAWQTARMLRYAMLCYAMLCYATICNAIAMLTLLPASSGLADCAYAMLRYAMICYDMLCYAMLCYAMLTLLDCFLWLGRLHLCYAML
eukprot:g72957.t1